MRFERADVDDDTTGFHQAGEMDLVSCRNLLIYFTPRKQDRVMARFRQSLRADGLLFLGSSENLSLSAQAAFRSLDPEHRIYARRADPLHASSSP